MFKSFRFPVQMHDKETIILERIFMIQYFTFKLGCLNTEKTT